MEAGRGRAARAAYLGVLATGLAAMLVVNLPGHLTLDSVLELYEGRFRIRQSWAPSFYAWVLGVFDAVLRGSALYVVVSALMVFAALASFVWLRPRITRWAAVAAAVAVASPLMVIYQAIVWKDVLFADAGIAGMVCLAWALRRRGPVWARWALLATTLVLLAAAALLRQNGVIVGVFAAAAFGWSESQGRARRGIAWGFGALAAIVLLSHVMNQATRPSGPDDYGGGGMSEGLHILQHYDILGALTLDPHYPLGVISDDAPEAATVLRTLGPRYYSAERTDVTDAQPLIQGALAQIDDDALEGEWSSLVLRHPWLYLRVRTAVFGWVFLTPRIDRCLPVSVGIQGPLDVLDQLGMKERWSETDDNLVAYDDVFTHTPLHSHLAYALAAAVVGLLLLRRRDPADVAMIALMASALAFAASFFIISIACDYRYLYFLDLSAIAGVLYLAVDPPWARRGRAEPPSLA